MQTEELLVRILNHLVDRMKDRLVVKGGMLLRLLESPRYTQDLDFVLPSKESKKVLVKELVSALREIPSIEVTRQDLSSRGIFIGIRDRESGTQATLETNVVPGTRLPPEPVSTAKISSLYSLSGRIVRVMAPAEAFSNKIAACLERGAGRDLYDISLFEPMTAFDRPTLEDRLSRLEVDRAKPRKVARDEAAQLLRKRLEDLSEQRLREEVFPLLPPDHQPGLLMVIRASVSRVIQRMQASN
jgi:predicted nucleotidyltransferase component of viral defense system